MIYYNYFVSYNHTSRLGMGSGMCQLFRQEHIKTFDDIVSVAELIKGDKFDEVVIVNYVFLGEVDESELKSRGAII